MKNFNELFKAAAEVSDRRKKVFNELIKKVREEILPKFCEACAGLDIQKVYFKTNNCILQGNDSEPTVMGYEERYYVLGINVTEKSIQDARYNDLDGYYIPDGWTMMPIKDVNFTRVGIVEFTKLLNSRLEDYINKYSEKNKEAANF